MQEVNLRNEYIFDGISVTEQDKLFTLSGCSHKYDVNQAGNHCIVVMVKLVDTGTAPVATIRLNPIPKCPQL